MGPPGGGPPEIPAVVPCVGVLSAAALYVLFRLMARKIAPKVKKTLHAMRKRLRRQQKRRRRGTVGNNLAWRLRKASVAIVHNAVKSAGERILEHSETFRIMLGLFKVVTHLSVKLCTFIFAAAQCSSTNCHTTLWN